MYINSRRSGQTEIFLFGFTALLCGSIPAKTHRRGFSNNIYFHSIKHITYHISKIRQHVQRFNIKMNGMVLSDSPCVCKLSIGITEGTLEKIWVRKHNDQSSSKKFIDFINCSLLALFVKPLLISISLINYVLHPAAPYRNLATYNHLPTRNHANLRIQLFHNQSHSYHPSSTPNLDPST